jgi:hypothetical protein
VVITMLPGGKHVLSVWADLLPHAHKGMLFIDSSTIDVDSARRAHELADSAGVLSVDAPVSGGTAGAKAGTLTFMCGAEEAAFAAGKARGIVDGDMKRLPAGPALAALAPAGFITLAGLYHISGFYLLLLSSRREPRYAIPML